MKTQNFLLIPVFALLLFGLGSCINQEDSGPIQETDKDYEVLDFDRLEMGDAFVVTVTRGTTFSVKAEGDRRNIEDLNVRKSGSTLRINFNDQGRRWGGRQYETRIIVTMPALKGANFSGSVTATVTGFDQETDFDFKLSGASTGQLEITAENVRINLSGSSELNISGEASNLDATVSGASTYRGFDFVTSFADVHASGSSRINLKATQTLKGSASGASTIVYRGNPNVNVSSSGSSEVSAD